MSSKNDNTVETHLWCIKDLFRIILTHNAKNMHLAGKIHRSQFVVNDLLKIESIIIL